MPVVPVTPDNLDHLKRAARFALPGVGSSHLSEALAALLGQRTHAALRAALTASAPSPLMVEPENGRFLERLRSLGYAALDVKMTPVAVACANLPTPAWREFRKSDLSGRNTWFRSCEQRCVPYICVTTRRKLASVDWDWISVDPRQDGKLVRLGERHVVNRMFAAFRERAAPSNALFEGSAFVGNVDGLTFEAARAIADKIALILNEAQQGGVAAETACFAH